MHHIKVTIIVVYLGRTLLPVIALIPFKGRCFKPLRISQRTRFMREKMAASASTDGDREDHLVHRYDSPFLSSDSNDQKSLPPAALIILNTPIINHNNPNKGVESYELPGVLNALWQSSSYRICADGGANRLYEATVASHEALHSQETASSRSFLPDLITGDLDSLLPHVQEFYEHRGVPIVRIEDQDYHDLDKALMAVENWLDERDSTNDIPTVSKLKSKVFIYGGFGGRFDQEMGCINALFVWGQRRKFRHTSMALYGEETCAFILPALPKTCEVRIRFPNGDDANSSNNAKGQYIVGEGPTCGLIPLGGRCDEVITTGLKWNLDGNLPLEFGGLVSSSNRVINELVTVKSSSALVFTAEIITKR
eukprot:CCRYP_005566-RA/>CCRYP_005566-RA protein AED:0.02 eAED:0.02 QI:298/1/1/1/1/1/2/76/366